MNLLKKSLTVEPNGAAANFGHFFLRVSAGLMVFYIHGLHKLEGWIAYLQHGTPWTLAEEVAGMHMPAPLASAVAATEDGNEAAEGGRRRTEVRGQRSEGGERKSGET
jgi:hypothetical protein